MLWGLSGSKKYLRRSIPPLPQGCLFFVQGWVGEQWELGLVSLEVSRHSRENMKPRCKESRESLGVNAWGHRGSGGGWTGKETLHPPPPKIPSSHLFKDILCACTQVSHWPVPRVSISSACEQHHGVYVSMSTQPDLLTRDARVRKLF